MDEATIQKNLASLQHHIKVSSEKYQRPPESICLLAVTKTQPVEAIMAAYQTGQKDFGENYLQEALPKIKSLQAYDDITWHFIGAIQSNKAMTIVQHFDWVHSVCSAKVAKKLNQGRPVEKEKLNVCIQINIDSEPGKSGVTVTEAYPLVEYILSQSNLKLRGLMIIPKPTNHPEKQFLVFQQLALLKEDINQQFQIDMDTLSMGMTNDYDMAIRAGSTILRVGQAIFGRRI